jgi:hypothetical protein
MRFTQKIPISLLLATGCLLTIITSIQVLRQILSSEAVHGSTGRSVRTDRYKQDKQHANKEK